MAPRPPQSVNDAARVATFTAAAMLAQQVAGKAARDALFLSSYSLASLPKAILVSALLSALGVFAFTRILTRLGPARGVPLVFFASSLFLVLEWVLGLRYPRASAIAIYAHMGLFGATVTSAFWTLVSERFDPHTAKQVVGRITAGGTIGSIVGGLVAWRVAHAIDARVTLLAMAVMNLVCAFGVLNIRGVANSRATSARIQIEHDGPTRPRLDVLRRTPYLTSLALLVGLGSATQALLDYLLNAQAVAMYGRGEELLTFFAFFYTICGVVSFALQRIVTRRALEALGLAGTVAVLPASLTVSFLAGILLSPFWTAIVTRGTEASLRSSLFRAA
jgi:ATP:ADP antiporter, AAA family